PALSGPAAGTSAARAALLALDGRPLAVASAESPTRHTSDGGAEQAPADWVGAARSAVAQALPLEAEVMALCLTGQMQDLVLEGEHGPVRPAVLYTDLRAGAEAEQIRAALAREGQDWDALTGNLQEANSCAAMFRRLARLH